MGIGVVSMEDECLKVVQWQREHPPTLQHLACTSYALGYRRAFGIPMLSGLRSVKANRSFCLSQAAQIMRQIWQSTRK